MFSNFLVFCEVPLFNLFRVAEQIDVKPSNALKTIVLTLDNDVDLLIMIDNSEINDIWTLAYKGNLQY